MPFILRWPGHIEPGTSDALVSQVDFLASFAELLDVKVPNDNAGDSRSTLDAFFGQDETGLSFFVSQSRSIALREGHWKFVPAVPPKSRRGWMSQYAPTEDQLFDLSKDPGETTNVIDRYPERASEMRTLLNRAKELHISEL